MVAGSGEREAGGGLGQDLDEFEGILSWFGYWVDAGAADGRYARHKDAEAIYMRLLNTLFGWNLVDASEPGHDEPGVDLRDDGRLIVVQVTSSCTSKKINDTLAKERIKRYRDGGYRLKFAFVGDQRNSSKVRSEGGWVIRNPHGIVFDRRADSIFIDDLTHAFRALGPDGRAELLELARGDIGRIGCGIPSQAVGVGVVRRINARLMRQRRNHPSFLLMEGGPDEGLFPKGVQVPNVARTVKADDRTLPFRDFVRESWATGEQTHLAIAGRGGVGKTVALLSFATEEGFLPWGVPAVYVPLYDLAQYADSGAKCLDRYIKQAFSRSELQVIQTLSKEPWVDGPNLILLLDGHNEIPTDKVYAVDLGIRAWAERAGAQLVATSRAAGPLGLADARRMELQGLSREDSRTYLGDDAPGESDARLWQLLETPLMLRLYAGSRSHDEDELPAYIRMEEADNAGRLVWNFLQRELARVVGRHRGGFSEVEYAVALLLVLPCVCWRMEAEREFTVDDDELDEYVSEACERWHGQDMPATFTKIERRLRQRLERMDSFDLECSQRVVLTDETCLLARRGDGYALMHQDFRDALAALHLRNAAEVPGAAVPPEFDEFLSEYVKDFLADLVGDGLLADLWERNRTRKPIGPTSTHNLLRVVHRHYDGDLSSLSFAGMDLRGINLYSYRDGMKLRVSGDALSFNGACFDSHCFMPQGHTEGVTSVCYSPDGSLIASGSWDTTILLWNSVNGQRIGVPLEGHSGPVWSISFAPDGSLLASGSDDGTVCLWNLRAHQLVKKLCVDHLMSVETVSFSPDGSTLASGSADGIIRIWDLNSYRNIPLKQRNGETVRSVSFSPDGTILASGSEDGIIRLWDVKNESQLDRRFGGSDKGDRCLCVRFSPDGKKLIGGFDSGSVYLWEIGSDCEYGSLLSGHSDSVWSVQFSPDGATIASASNDETIRLWSVAGQQQIGAALEKGEGSVGCVCFSPSGLFLASGSADGVVRQWDVRHRQLAGAQLDGRVGEQILVMRLSPDGSSLATGSIDGTVRLWNLNQGRSVIPPLKGHSSWIESLCFSPNGSLVASGGHDGAICLWDALTGYHMSTLHEHGNWVRSVCFSPDGRFVAGGYTDRAIRLWDISTGQQIGSPVRFSHSDFDQDGLFHEEGGESSGIVAWWPILSISFSPDGKLIASGDYSHVCLWDTSTSRPAHKPRLVGETTSVQFSSDGDILACGMRDGKIHIVDVDKGKRTGKHLNGCGDQVVCICFDPHDDYLVSCTGDGEVMKWNLRRNGKREGLVLRNKRKRKTHGDGAESKPCIAVIRNRVWYVEFSPEGRLIVQMLGDNAMEVQDNGLLQSSNSVTIEPLPCIDLTDVDLSLAILSDHDKTVLWQNGVNV